MQSGISASQELLDQFNTLLSNPDHFGLLATIENESLKPVTLLTPPPSAGPNFADKLATLQPHLTATEPLYVLLRRYDEPPALVAVTYVPDAAKVRQKMLMSSTALTLVRQLGSEHFRGSGTLFASAPEELTARGFERHDAHDGVDAPLTEEERALGDVRRAEAEAGMGTASRAIHLSSHAVMPVREEALAALKRLAAAGGAAGASLVMLKVNPDSEAIELADDSASPTTIAELTQAISATEPRFSFWRYRHSYGGGDFDSLLFFYTCPVTPGRRAVKDRMLYPLMKKAVLTIAESECGLQIDKRFELEEPGEITEESVLEDLHPKVQVRQGFSRPKRPGR